MRCVLKPDALGRDSALGISLCTFANLVPVSLKFILRSASPKNLRCITKIFSKYNFHQKIQNQLISFYNEFDLLLEKFTDTIRQFTHPALISPLSLLLLSEPSVPFQFVEYFFQVLVKIGRAHV